MSKIIHHVLGASASFYLATYLTQKGVVAAGPLLITAIIAGILLACNGHKHDVKKLTSNEKMWIVSLAAFGCWGLLTVWIEQGAENLYEVPAKFIVGAMIAIPIIKYSIDIRWIKLGVLVGCVVLGVLAINSYSGGRFSPVMNATKWGNAVAFQTILTFALALNEKVTLQKILYVVLGLMGTYITIMTGTRGAILPLMAMLVITTLIYLKNAQPKHLIALMLLIVLTVAGASQLKIAQDRINATLSDFKSLETDNHWSSIGIRLTMWRAGLQATLDSPFMGHGYNFETVFTQYEAPSPGLQKAAERIGHSFRLFHSAYIDTLVTKGVIGLFLFLMILSAGVWSKNKEQFLLMFAPTLGFAAAGITDSALALGITSSYLILAGTLLKATKKPY